MTDLTNPRPHFLDSLRAAYRAFRDPNAAYTRGLATGLAIYPSVRARVVGQ